ncbi:MAG: hypothetical protein QXH27_02975 [Candidatus Micrarchaeia archaeon]
MACVINLRDEIPKPSAILSTKAGYEPLRRFYSSRVVRRLLNTRIGRRVLGWGDETAEFYGLVRQLKHGEEWTARGAAHALSINHRKFRSFHPLVETLRDANMLPSVRGDAALALAKLCENAPDNVARAGEANLVETALHERDKSVSISALKALGTFKSEEAVRALVKAVGRGGLEGAYAAESLGNMALALREKPGGESAEKTLKLLENEAHPALLRVLSGDGEVYARVYAANALITIRKRLGENEERCLITLFEKEGDARVRDAVVDVLAVLGGRASLEVLEKFAAEDKRVEWAVQEIKARLEG